MRAACGTDVRDITRGCAPNDHDRKDDARSRGRAERDRRPAAVTAATVRGKTTRALLAVSRILERGATASRTQPAHTEPVVAHRPFGRPAAPGPVAAAPELDGRSFGSPREAITAVLTLLETQLPGSDVVLGLLDPSAGAFRVVDVQGESSFALQPGVAVPLEASFAVLVATEQRPVFSGPAAPPVFGAMDVQDTVLRGPYAGVPLRLSDDTPIGSLCATSRGARGYDARDLNLLTVMARVLAHAFDCDRTQEGLRRQAEEYREHATTDVLTGVLNRRGFLEGLNREWQLSHRGTVVSYLVVADVDGLKAANDRLGHAEGDGLLQDVARALTGAARVSDAIGRLGGDEFGVVLIGCDGDADAAAFCARARDRLKWLLLDRAVPVTLSFGFHSLADARSPERALALADSAMYKDKVRPRLTTDPGRASTTSS